MKKVMVLILVVICVQIVHAEDARKALQRYIGGDRSFLDRKSLSEARTLVKGMLKESLESVSAEVRDEILQKAISIEVEVVGGHGLRLADKELLSLMLDCIERDQDTKRYEDNLRKVMDCFTKSAIQSNADKIVRLLKIKKIRKDYELELKVMLPQNYWKADWKELKEAEKDFEDKLCYLAIEAKYGDRKAEAQLIELCMDGPGFSVLDIVPMTVAIQFADSQRFRCALLKRIVKRSLRSLNREQFYYICRLCAGLRVFDGCRDAIGPGGNTYQEDLRRIAKQCGREWHCK